MSEADQGRMGPAQSGELLSRIAAALAVQPATLLSNESLEIEARDACELLRLWHGLNVPANRQKLLAFARTLSLSESAQ